MAQTSLSGDSKIDSVLSTFQWGDSNGTAITLSYSFPTSGSSWNNPYSDENEPFSPNVVSYFNQTQQNATGDIFSKWSNVANINFVLVDEPDNQGDIRLAFSTIVGQKDASGWAYYPPTYPPTISRDGDIWIDHTITDLTLGTYNSAVISHELGHALGLKHSFEPDDVFNPNVLPTSEDTTQYTLMSYTDYTGAGFRQVGSSNTYEPVSPTTPMLYDVAAVQFLYGANTDYNTGDDIYTFSNSEPEMLTIWDAGGNDTIDLSNQSLDMEIDLNAGAFSSIGMRYVLQSNGYFIDPTPVAAVDNVAIAYGVEIENAIGGSGDDILTGNALDNTFIGGGGNDSIDGGEGEDIAVYSGNFASYAVEKSANSIQVSSTGTVDEGIDSLTNIEKIQFDDLALDTATMLVVPDKPLIPADVVTQPLEGDYNHINYFLLQISAPLSVDASVDFATRDGSAIAGEDYVATSGTATIAAGETSTLIAVEIIADTISEADETFELVITNPQGGIFPEGTTEISAMRTIIDDDGGASAFPIVEIVGVEPYVSA